MSDAHDETTLTAEAREDAIALLTSLVGIPSESGEERAASEHLVAWMNDHGMQAFVDDAGNAVGIAGDPDATQEVLLLGHIDTFPGEVPLRREGDLFYGRGSVDAKGPLCTFATAAAATEVPEGWRIRVVGAVEEECATSKGARYIGATTETAPFCCVIGEPSRWDRITLGYKGRLLMKLTLRLPFAHSAGQELLPAEQGVALWQQIAAECLRFDQANEARRPFEQLSPSLRGFQSEDHGAFGVVHMQMGFRLPPGTTPAEVQTRLHNLVMGYFWPEDAPTGTTETTDPHDTAPATTTFTCADEDIDLRLHFSGGELAHKGGKSNPLVRAYLGAIRGAGGKPRFVVKTGTCDMNVLAPLWPETPFVAYGPGDSSLDHTPHEHIDLNEYTRAIEVLRGMLARVMG